MNYKTIKCKMFHENAFCAFGKRCQFVHNGDSQENFKKLTIDYNQYWEIFSAKKPMEEGFQIENPEIEKFIEKISPINYGFKKLQVLETLRLETPNEAYLSNY